LDGFEAIDATDQSAFAAAARTADHHHVPGSDAEVDVAQHMERPEPFVDLAKFDHGYADLENDLIAKRWSAYYINNGFLQE
jgi:hypothetical protein